MESITSYRMPPVLKYFHHRYPRLQIALRTEPVRGESALAASGTVRRGLPGGAETQASGVHSEVLGVEPLVVVALVVELVCGTPSPSADPRFPPRTRTPLP